MGFDLVGQSGVSPSCLGALFGDSFCVITSVLQMYWVLGSYRVFFTLSLASYSTTHTCVSLTPFTCLGSAFITFSWNLPQIRVLTYQTLPNLSQVLVFPPNLLGQCGVFCLMLFSVLVSGLSSTIVGVSYLVCLAVVMTGFDISVGVATPVFTRHQV